MMVDKEQDNSTVAVMNQNDQSIENEFQNAIIEENNNNNDDEFIRVTAAHQILNEAQTYEEENNHSVALQLYRICVDLLLEELMFAQGTDQSQIYLRERCTALMDHIDTLKTKLEPIPLTMIDEEESTNNPPTDQLEALQLP